MLLDNYLKKHVLMMRNQKVIKMNYKEALETVKSYEHWVDSSCVCFMGNPPCGKCTECPTLEDYEEAQLIIEDENIKDLIKNAKKSTR